MLYRARTLKDIQQFTDRLVLRRMQFPILTYRSFFEGKVFNIPPSCWSEHATESMKPFNPCVFLSPNSPNGSRNKRFYDFFFSYLIFTPVAWEEEFNDL